MGGAKIDLAQDFSDLLRAFVDHNVRFLRTSRTPSGSSVPPRKG